MIKRIGSEWSGEETVAACRLRKRNLRPVSLPAACMLAEPLRSASADFRLVQPMGGRRAQEGRRESRVRRFSCFSTACAPLPCPHLLPDRPASVQLPQGGPGPCALVPSSRMLLSLFPVGDSGFSLSCFETDPLHVIHAM